MPLFVGLSVAVLVYSTVSKSYIGESEVHRVSGVSGSLFYFCCGQAVNPEAWEYCKKFPYEPPSKFGAQCPSTSPTDVQVPWAHWGRRSTFLSSNTELTFTVDELRTGEPLALDFLKNDGAVDRPCLAHSKFVIPLTAPQINEAYFEVGAPLGVYNAPQRVPGALREQGPGGLLLLEHL